MSDFLQQMAVSSAGRASRIGRRFTAADLDRPLYPLALRGFDLIAEIKDRSPAEGELGRSNGRRGERAAQYARGGAAAISVLTEPDHFAGTLEHLREVVEVLDGQGVPVMRKDFLVDPLQVLEARAAGASGVLLIAAILSDEQLASMLDCAWEHSLFVLLESFDRKDLQRSVRLLDADSHLQKARSGQLLFGINSRDLRTLDVDKNRLQELAPLMPEGSVHVAESGLYSAANAAAAAGWGYAMALVGTALMRSERPDELIRDMLAAGRQKVAA